MAGPGLRWLGHVFLPPHNLREVVAVIKAYIANPKITPQEIMAIMPGADFPTGGKIPGRDDILEYYSTGHANLKLEGIHKIEKGKRDKIVITELPYQVGPDKLCLEIKGIG